MTTHDYKEAGVDIAAGNETVDKIKPLVAKTHSPLVLNHLGGFGSLFHLGPLLNNFKDPVLVQSVDGVGTKVSVAAAMDSWESIGWDVVSAVCNDILVTGARSLTFLDYVAASKLKPDTVARIVAGMAENCATHGVSLVGGETAEMPGVYAAGEHDVVGCGLGIVERSEVITGETVSEGDVLLGCPSSGLHTNGYSLARHLFFKIGGHKPEDTLDGLEGSIGQALLARHINYQPHLDALQKNDVPIAALAHITGGGILENLPRVFPVHLDAMIDTNSWKIPPLFQHLVRLGNLPPKESFKTLNMGIGFVITVKPEVVETAISILQTEGLGPVYKIGTMTKGSGKVILSGKPA